MSDKFNEKSWGQLFEENRDTFTNIFLQDNVEGRCKWNWEKQKIMEDNFPKHKAKTTQGNVSLKHIKIFRLWVLCLF